MHLFFSSEMGQISNIDLFCDLFFLYWKVHFNNLCNTEEKRIRFFQFFSLLCFIHTYLCFCLIFASVCRSLGFVHSKVEWESVLILEKHVKPEFVPASRSSLEQEEPTCFSVSPWRWGNKEQKVNCVYLDAKNTDHTVAPFVAVTQLVQRGLERQWVS